VLLNFTSFLSKFNTELQFFYRQEKAFSRKRHLPIEDLIGTLVYRYISKNSSGSKLLSASYFKQKNNNFLAKKGLSRSSFSEARSKLSWEAFAYLLNEVPKVKTIKWKGHHLRAVDGTKITLPRSKEVIKEFPAQNNFLGEAHYPQARLVAASDVVTGQITKAMVCNKYLSEQACLKDLLKSFESGDISLLDRGFMGRKLWFEFKEHKQYFLAHMKATGRGVLRGFNPKERDALIDIIHPDTGEVMVIRIIKCRQTKKGKNIYLITNLINKKKYKRKDLAELYLQRQVVEESFKQLKQGLKLELTLRVKKLNNVLQEIYAAVLAQTLVSVIKHSVLMGKGKVISFAGATYALSCYFTDLLITAKNKNTMDEILEIISHHYHFKQTNRSYPRFSRQAENKWVAARRKTKENNMLTP